MQKSFIMSISAVMLMTSAATALADSESLQSPQYIVKQAEPSLGSRLRREVVRSTDIPVNRRYEQLTNEEKQMLLKKYDSFDNADEPPFPKDGLLPVLRDIITGLRNGRIDTEGNLKLYVWVDASGKPTKVEQVSTPNGDLTDVASTILMLHKFKPALCKGTPCAMKFPFEVRFSRTADQTYDSDHDINYNTPGLGSGAPKELK